MNMDSELAIVYNSRLLESEDDVRNFERSLSNIVHMGNILAIPSLCKCFDDDTEDDEVMFGLVHSIEELYKSNEYEGLYNIALSVRHIIDVSRVWVETLHYRILNGQSTRYAYGKVLSQIPDVDRIVVVKLLKDIKNEDPDLFGKSVDQVLSM